MGGSWLNYLLLIPLTLLAILFVFCLFHKIIVSCITKCMLLLLSCFSSVRLCVTPRDSRPPGSAIPGILQARTLEWVAISFSNAWQWKVKVKPLSHVWLFATPWTAAYQAPPSVGFSRQEYWSWLPLPSPNQVYEPPTKIMTGLQAVDQVYSSICDQWL